MRAGYDITVRDLALAYELRQEGCSWKNIAHGLGCDWAVLKGLVRNAVNGGLHSARRKIPEASLETATIMRRNSRLSWRCIAAYLGHDTDALRVAVWVRTNRSTKRKRNNA